MSMITANELVSRLKDPSPEDIALLKRAYDLSKKAHEGHVRFSGEPFFTHAAAVAALLADYGMDTPSVAAGLLHSAVRFGRLARERVEEVCDDETLFLVEGVGKLAPHAYRGSKRHAESLRRLLVATASDVRVLIVKLADRHHDMETLAHVPDGKRRQIAVETLEIYAPLADRLGMGRLKRDLEDLAFPYVDPDAARHTAELRKLKTRETEAGLMRVRRDIQTELAKNDFTFRTDTRLKGLWSLHEKLLRKGNDITQIYDIAALRIVVPGLEDCYAALGIVHALYHPLPGGFKDYIAFPKGNGYQSLHTTVVTPEAGIVEIQIRTEEMHRRAQFGVISHMSYKQIGKQVEKLGSEAQKGRFAALSFSWVRSLIPTLMRIKKPVDEKSGIKAPLWLEELANAHLEVASSKEFITGLKEDFFSHRVFVFTPRGDVVDLPAHSTPIDFAYAIHTDLGNHLQGAKVNGKLVAFDTPLQNGDVVEILRRESARPSPKWLEHVRTSLARKQIRAALGMPDRRRGPRA